MSHFNDVANEWDSPEKVKLMQTLAKNTLEQVKLDKGLKVLDFGCGTGLFGLEFSEYIDTLIGIDTSEGMLRVFDEKTKEMAKYRSLNLNLEKESLEEQFDLIVTSMAFHHLDNPFEVLKKFKKMLNPGGRIFIVDLDEEDGSFHPDNDSMGVKHFGFSKDVLQKWAGDLGFGFNHSIVNSLDKNGRSYSQFLAIFS